MRYRTLDANGDYTFGRGTQEFLVNSPEAVAQAVKTRLLLEQGEWFLDTTEGTPYSTEILGVNTKSTYDAAIRERILDTPGVNSILTYTSNLNPTNRALTITTRIDTIYGATTISLVL